MILNQLTLSPQDDLNTIDGSWGTFKDNLSAPVHSWFQYPAGFSYKAVIRATQQFGLNTGQTIYDPFMGSGTTNVVAQTLGLNSIGTDSIIARIGIGVGFSRYELIELRKRGGKWKSNTHRHKVPLRESMIVFSKH